MEILPTSDYFVEPSETCTDGNKLLHRYSYIQQIIVKMTSNRCISCWNYLPLSITSADSITCFRRLLFYVGLGLPSLERSNHFQTHQRNQHKRNHVVP